MTAVEGGARFGRHFEETQNFPRGGIGRVQAISGRPPNNAPVEGDSGNVFGPCKRSEFLDDGGLGFDHGKTLIVFERSRE